MRPTYVHGYTAREAQRLLHQADLLELPFPEGAFDHVFLCFVLDHLPDPERALRRLARVVRRGDTVTAIEGDHGYTFFKATGRR